MSTTHTPEPNQQTETPSIEQDGGTCQHHVPHHPSCESTQNPHGVDGCLKTATTYPTKTLSGHRRFRPQLGTTCLPALATPTLACAVAPPTTGACPRPPLSTVGCTPLPHHWCRVRSPRRLPAGRAKDHPLWCALAGPTAECSPPAWRVGCRLCLSGRSEPLGRSLRRPRGLTSCGGGLGVWGWLRDAWCGAQAAPHMRGVVHTQRLGWRVFASNHQEASPCPTPLTVATTPTPPPP